MSKRARRIVVVTSLALFTACQHSSSGSSFLAPGVNNLAVPVDRIWLADGTVVGRRTGPGALGLEVVDLRTGQTTTVANVVNGEPVVCVGGGFVSFCVSESNAGRDLNGDGDQSDAVLHVLNARSGTIKNLGLDALNAFAQDGGLIAFCVAEFSQGVDLDGDGELRSVMEYVYDARRGLLTPLDLPVQFNPGIVAGTHVVFSVDERDIGDLNGDGFISEDAVYVYDSVTGTTRNVQRTADTIRVDGSLLALEVCECDGVEDMNGNGSSGDNFVELHDLDTGFTRVTTERDGLINGVGGGLANLTLESGQFVYDVFSDELHAVVIPNFSGNDFGLSDRRMACLIDEFAVNEDLDGDQLIQDKVLNIFDARTGRLTSAATASFSIPQIDAEHVAFLSLSEPSPFRPPTNTTVHVLDLATGAVRDLGLLASWLLLADQRIVAVTPEVWQGADLNGDGDIGDYVVQVHDLRTGQTLNTGLATEHLEGALFSEDPIALADGVLALGVSEADQSADLDGDNDRQDLVLAAVRLP